MNRLIQDVMYTLRQLRKAPGFALIVVLTLSLGIGAAAAVFSVVDAALLRRLPFAHQDRLVAVNTNSQSGYQQPASYLGYLDERAQLRTFAALAGYSGSTGNINLEAPSGPVSLRVVKGTDNFFDVFGVKPILGRTFLPGEDQPGRDGLAVLSYEVWQTQFGGQTNAVGKVVRLDGAPYTVIGIMPSGFRFPLSARNAVYTPLHAKPEWAKSRGTHWLPTVGLLKDGVSREQGQADVTRVLTDIGRANPDSDAGRTGSLVSLAEAVNSLGNGRTLNGPLGMLSLAVLALLGIACVNVAGLLLARGVKREREIALRAAVGAGRLRLVRQLLTESLVLSAAGLAGGILVAWALLAAMRSFLVEAIARGVDVHMNTTVLAVAAALSVLTSVAASLGPAGRLSGMDPNRALRAGGGAGTGVGQHRLRSLFVVTQVALSLVLLVVSGLLLRNLRDLLHTNLGFDPKTILTMEIDLSQGRYEGRDPLIAFYQPLLERVSHLPGVVGAGVTTGLPVLTNGTNSEVHITGQPPYPKNQEMLAEVRFVSEGYFDAMGIRQVRGRMLSPGLDKADNPAGTVVVNEAFRRKFFSGGGDPVGAHMDDSDKAEQKTGIAGAVADVRQDLQQPPLAEMDWLIDEIDAKDRLGYMSNMMLAVRSDGDLMALVPALRSALHEVDATVPFKTPETMTQVVNESLVFERMEGWLFGIFAALALLLAVIGVYGLVQHEVELRTREIGIRMALGSTRSMVMSRIMRRVAVLMVGGVCVGLALTVALKKVLAAAGAVHANHDFAFLAALTAVWIATGVLASVAPAQRAASIDPIKALRIE